MYTREHCLIWLVLVSLSFKHMNICMMGLKVHSTQRDRPEADRLKWRAEEVVWSSLGWCSSFDHGTGQSGRSAT